MKNWQKKFLFLSIGLFSFSKMEAQTSFAIVFQDSIDAFVEEFFFEKNEELLKIKKLKDSLLREDFKIYTEKFSLLGQMCSHELPPIVRKEYSEYLKKELLSTYKSLDSITTNIEKSADLVLQNHLQNFYKKIAIEHNLSFILNANQLNFYDKNILDLTPLLIKNLNQTKTILSQQMYFKDFTIPLILKTHSKIKLVDYPTFMEAYKNPKGAW